MTDDDPRLVRRALDGEADAAQQLFARHFDDAWRAAFGLTASRPAADDVTQAAFEKAFRSLGTFSGEGSFGAWLRRIVVNQGLDHLRRDRRRRAAEVALDDLAHDWEGASAEPGLAAAIRLLGPDRRAVVVLHHWLGYTLAEAAELMGVPVGTAQSRLARAMTDLRDALGVPT